MSLCPPVFFRVFRVFRGLPFWFGYATFGSQLQNWELAAKERRDHQRNRVV